VVVGGLVEWDLGRVGWGGGEGWGRVYFVVMRVCREEVLVGGF